LPVAYILGKKEFWSLEFLVTPAVLIPRPETELLVEASLKKAAGGKKPLVIGEMGCGSGAVIVSLARELGPGRFYATDTCSYALGVARRNAIRHGVENKISFLRSDLLAALISQGLKGELDQVLSNPPYIPRGQMPSLPGEIRLYEPKQALDGGEDGFLVYRRLIPQALTFLKPGGWLLLEMGEGQAGAISALLWQAGGFGEIEVWRDYQGMDRVICAQRGRSRVG
jgi:release factor glutamine methyltransferase